MDRYDKTVSPGRLDMILTLVFLAIGIAERGAYAIFRQVGYGTGEAGNVAVALAEGRGFADAFQLGQGPTAHLLPIPPMIAAGFYALLGSRTPAAEFALCLWAMILTFGSFWLFSRVIVKAGAAPRAGLAAFGLLCVLPIYTTTEVFDFRVWEGGIVLVLAGTLLRMLFDAEDGRRWRGFGWWLALLPALIFFVNPPVGLAAFTAWALFIARHRREEPWPRHLVLLVLALAVLIGAWTARNAAVMGHPIWLRDNVGLELSVANHAGAVGDIDARAVLNRRLDAIHPFASPAAFRAMQAAGGEIAYSQILGAHTLAWMQAHPADVATIWLRHLREVLFPGPDLFMTAHGKWMPLIRAAIADLIGALGLLGIAMAIRRRDMRYAYLIGFVLIPALCYVPFQPIVRYMWLLYPPLACLAMDAVWRMTRLRLKRDQATRTGDRGRGRGAVPATTTRSRPARLASSNALSATLSRLAASEWPG